MSKRNRNNNNKTPKNQRFQYALIQYGHTQTHKHWDWLQIFYHLAYKYFLSIRKISTNYTRWTTLISLIKYIIIMFARGERYQLTCILTQIGWNSNNVTMNLTCIVMCVCVCVSRQSIEILSFTHIHNTHMYNQINST